MKKGFKKLLLTASLITMFSTTTVFGATCFDNGKYFSSGSYDVYYYTDSAGIPTKLYQVTTFGESGAHTYIYNNGKSVMAVYDESGISLAYYPTKNVGNNPITHRHVVKGSTVRSCDKLAPH